MGRNRGPPPPNTRTPVEKNKSINPAHACACSQPQRRKHAGDVHLFSRRQILISPLVIRKGVPLYGNVTASREAAGHGNGQRGGSSSEARALWIQVSEERAGALLSSDSRRVRQKASEGREGGSWTSRKPFAQHREGAHSFPAAGRVGKLPRFRPGTGLLGSRGLEQR